LKTGNFNRNQSIAQTQQSVAENRQ